ncbi:MAG: TetR/AcrR family transcriptional regulator [Gemmataceae bacterium]
MSKTLKKSDRGLVERRREEILDAAAKLFAKRGYSETDTQVLADELGVGKGTLYRYFKSKRDLFLAAADRVMRQLREHIRQRREAVADPVERVRVAIRAFLEYCGEHPEFVELLMLERAQFKDRTKPTYLTHREAYVGYWQELYRTMIEDGRVRDIPVARITDVVHALIYGTLFTNYFARTARSVDEQVDDVIDVLFHGILSPAERRRRGQE